ncbi:MAG TPA: hypothetical protein VMT88_07435 [Actinomycetes bacterium]|nr:hypothetical protein [Actinomycetes bacterium]
MKRSSRIVPAVALSLTIVAALSGNAAGSTVDVTPPNPFDLIADAGDYQTGYSIASPWTSVSVSWDLTTDDSSNVVYEMAVDGVIQRVVEASDGYETLSKHVDVPDGQHVITVTAVDASGNRQPANHSIDVVVDKVTPVFTSFPLLILRTGPVALDAIPVRYTWTAADEGTGLAHIRVGYGHDCCFQLAPTATSFNFTVEQGSLRNWRVFIEDGVGRIERVTRQVVVEPVRPGDVKRVGEWDVRSVSGAIDGDERISSKSGDRVSVKVTGRSVSWVTAKGPKRGVADVYIDGKLVSSVDLKAPSLMPSRSVWASKLGLGESHRVTIVNRSPRSRSLVGLDTILVQA